MTATDDALIRGLIQQADRAAAAGQRDEVQRLLTRAEAAAPEHPMVLNARAIQLLQSGSAEQARELLERALRADAANPSLWMNLATALRALGRRDEEEAALQKVLTQEPRHLLALLQKAELLEFKGKPKAAATTYHHALQTLQPNMRLPNVLRDSIARAFEVVRKNDEALAAHVDRALGDLRAKHDDATRDRAEHGLGRRRIYHPQPTFLHIPKLPSYEFFSREHFPWLRDFEAATADIRAECQRVLEEDSASLEPYISRPDGQPLDQWAELNKSRRWSAFFLWRDGKRIDAHADRCPRTSALLAAAPLAQMSGYAPTAFFSILDRQSHIPAHTGATNARLIAHLPLVVPAGCRFRVGSETREWREGEAWVFDDTIEHEAWNESDIPRAILIFDTWHPGLTPADREVIQAAVPAIKNYYGDEREITGAN